MGKPYHFHRFEDVDLDYGCGRYDYNKGTLLCVAPGQIGGKEDNGERVSITGWALLFHPDLLHGTPLEKRIRDYSFFDYRVNEALHMTDEEHDIMVSLMRQMREELGKNPDGLQNAILVGYIELALNFCQRFYNRQFITRKIENSDILVRFDSLLDDYFEDGLQLTLGLPTVRHQAGQERACGRGDRIPGLGPSRFRILPAFQPDVQESGRNHAFGILSAFPQHDLADMMASARLFLHNCQEFTIFCQTI